MATPLTTTCTSGPLWLIAVHVGAPFEERQACRRPRSSRRVLTLHALHHRGHQLIHWENVIHHVARGIIIIIWFCWHTHRHDR
ncbi:MAG: hypothetical protein VYB08_12900, partial [Candidatus Latescibacterota bacterium]|nr:hypothetical protein [Candidatus Latescibacterota bacterium]